MHTYDIPCIIAELKGDRNSNITCQIVKNFNNYNNYLGVFFFDS